MRIEKLVLKSVGVQEMAADEVKNIVGEQKYNSIKSADAHPFFVELLVAHEGVSTGKILGAGARAGAKKFWSPERIAELADKLTRGAVPVYLYHDNANRPRRKVGEIICALVKKVRDRASALAYAYISDPAVRELIRKKTLDTCSLEADLVFERREKSAAARGVDWIVNAIEAVSGLALGSKSVSRPGFPGAAILAQVEEFEDAPGAAGNEMKELEQSLAEKEQELDRLKSELARYSKEREREERKRKVAEIVERSLSDRNLKREERRLVLEEVSERLDLKEPDPEHVEQEVKQELARELGRLAALRRIYQHGAGRGAPAPLESEENPNNPLIPKD